MDCYLLFWAKEESWKPGKEQSCKKMIKMDFGEIRFGPSTLRKRFPSKQKSA